MDRKECLDAAKQCVCSDRDQQYGSPAVNMKKIAEFWTTYKGVEFSPKDVAAMMSLVKLARISSGQAKPDNWIDGCGYLAIGCELEGNSKLLDAAESEFKSALVAALSETQVKTEN